MCVACPYIGSEGSTARKSALRASTFLHPALVNIILSVEKRRLSLTTTSLQVGVPITGEHMSQSFPSDDVFIIIYIVQLGLPRMTSLF